MLSREKIQVRWVFVVLLLLVGICVVLLEPGSVRTARQLGGWLAFDVRQKIFLEQDAARPTYDDTAKGPISLAAGVRQLHAGWPGESVAVVHGAAQEVATALLHHDDIEVGTIVGGKFVPWQISRWAAEEKIRIELRSMREFLTDESRYVFRRKPAAN